MLDSTALSQVFENWLSEALQNRTFNVSIDGKSCRGVVQEGKPKGKALHLLNVFAHDIQVALAQYPLEEKEGESTVARANLEALIQKYPGIVLFTLDAGLSGRNLCETIVQFGKDYLALPKKERSAAPLNSSEIASALSRHSKPSFLYNRSYAAG